LPPGTPPPPPPPPKSTRKGKEFVRRMPDHVLPPYVEANFRLMTFIMTRAPKLSDFPHERCAARAAARASRPCFRTAPPRRFFASGGPHHPSTHTPAR
jgi:hypothetical protein